MTQTKFEIRLLDEDSLDAVLNIERQVHLAPWSAKKFQACFNNSSLQLFGCFFELKFAGYAVLQIIEPEAELQNFAIAKEFQQQGLGSDFLSTLIRHCQYLALEKMLLEVRESNSAAIRLYRQLGFIHQSSRENYYRSESGRENALLMTKEL